MLAFAAAAEARAGTARLEEMEEAARAAAATKLEEAWDPYDVVLVTFRYSVPPGSL